MEKLSSGIKGLVVNQDMEKSQEERMNLFFHFVEVEHLFLVWPVEHQRKLELEYFVSLCISKDPYYAQNRPFL